MSHVKEINEESKQVQNQLSEDELVWRTALKEGDLIDALHSYIATESKNGFSERVINSWQPAKVTICDNKGAMLVSFPNCPRSFDIKVHRHDIKIAKSGTYTEDWDWRFNIEEKDEFDCCDELGTWYKSMCLERTDDPEELDCLGNIVPRARIAHRYRDDNGVKTLEGLNYTGFTKVDFE